MCLGSRGAPNSGDSESTTLSDARAIDRCPARSGVGPERRIDPEVHPTTRQRSQRIPYLSPLRKVVVQQHRDMMDNAILLYLTSFIGRVVTLGILHPSRDRSGQKNSPNPPTGNSTCQVVWSNRRTASAVSGRAFQALYSKGGREIPRQLLEAIVLCSTQDWTLVKSMSKNQTNSVDRAPLSVIYLFSHLSANMFFLINFLRLQSGYKLQLCLSIAITHAK